MNSYFIYIAIMAMVTYLIRMLPITLFQKEIKRVYIKSFLYYVPFAVLGAMTFPAIFYATGNVYSSIVGCVVAFVLAYKEKSLISVAAFACLSSYIITIIFL